MRKFNTKECPRCGEKCLISQAVCPDCGLVFAKLLKATNKEAKRQIIKNKKTTVLYSKDWPYDVMRWKALLLCGILGLFGAHNYYLGKFRKAIFCTITMIITIVFASLTVYPKYYDYIIYLFGFFGACPMIFWFWDFAAIATNKYKIPIAISPEQTKQDEVEK